MYWYNRNWFVLYREVFFIQSVFYQRFHCSTFSKERKQPLYKGQNGRSQCVHYSEVPLYMVHREDM